MMTKDMPLAMRSQSSMVQETGSEPTALMRDEENKPAQ
jgi:hypothetical protein